MGFLTRKKKKFEDEPVEEVTKSTEENDDSADEDEDDFSPIIKKPKPEQPTREEFTRAAKENLISAAEAKAVPEEKVTEEAADGEEPVPEIDAAAEDASDGEEASDDIDSGEPAVGGEDLTDTGMADDETEEYDAAPEASDSEAAKDASADEGAYDGDDFTANADSSPQDGEVSEDIDAPDDEKVEKVSFKEFRTMHKRFFRTVYAVFGGLFAACALLYIYGCVTVPKDVIGRNIYIENVDVSNLTPDEAVKKLQNEPLLSNQNIVVSCNNQFFTIKGVDVGLTAKLEDTVSKAMYYGKTKNIFIDGFANALQVIYPHKVIPSAAIDEAALRAKLDEFGLQLYGERVEHDLQFGDGGLVCTPGHSGYDTNNETAYNEVINSIKNEKFSNIPVTLSKGAPKDYTTEELCALIQAEPVDAHYEMVNNEVTVVPEVQGRVPDAAIVAGFAPQLHEGGEVITIPYTITNAAVTAQILQEKLFNATIASYSTSYGTSNANRCANIANAASKINGKILMPGEVFSFNDTVGPRSVANGFYTAKEYVDGQTVDGIGGGTCQVSSTLYNAVLYSDLSIVSRTNHMFTVGYCPLGQDATVADTGVDFKFVNSMDYPIKISAVTGGYRIVVSIIGTQRDVPRTVKIFNSATSVGGDTKVSSVRYVYDSAGNQISKDQLPGSYYKAH